MPSPAHCLWAHLRFAKGVGATVTTEAFPTEGNAELCDPLNGLPLLSLSGLQEAGQ